MADCADGAALEQEASCFLCLSAGELDAVQLYLLCQWAGI